MLPVQVNSLEAEFSAGASGLRNPVKGELMPLEIIDLVVTPNHKMFISKDKKSWSVVDAEKVTPSTYFRGVPDGFKSRYSDRK